MACPACGNAANGTATVSVPGVVDARGHFRSAGDWSPFSADRDTERLLHCRSPRACDWSTSTFETAGEVYATKTPGGETAVAVYRGPYSGLVEAYHAIDEWMVANRRESAGHSWEIYGDPTPDPADTETTVDSPRHVSSTGPATRRKRRGQRSTPPGHRPQQTRFPTAVRSGSPPC